MAYTESGDQNSSTVVVFLNGLDQSYNVWNSVRGIMQERFPMARYIQLDLLGQGATAKLTQQSSTYISYQQQISLLREFFVDQGISGKNVVLIGHSYGGGIAARFARDNPGLIKRAILISPFVDNLETHAGPAGSVMAMFKASYEAFGMKSLYDAQVQAGFAVGAMATWNSMGRGKGATVENIIALSNGIRDVHMSETISRVGDTTVDFIISSRDELIPNSAHSSLYEHLPTANRGWFLRINASHESPSQSPELVASALLHIFYK